jgi:hypothetical protein
VERLASLLSSRYGLAVERIEPAPRGWTGETWFAMTREGTRYFVKVYPRDRLPPTALPGLPVLAELHRLGLNQVSRPIPATDGALHVALGETTVVVFTCVDGVRAPFTFGGKERGDLLARIHELTKQVAVAVERETFTPYLRDELLSELERAKDDPGIDPLRRDLRGFVAEREAEIKGGWATYERIAEACRAKQFEFVVTHTDWPFNVMERASGGIVLIDWDELLLAPAERDTWFARGDPAFWRAYRARRPEHVESALATAYYVHARYFGELVDFVQVVLGDDRPDKRAESMALLDGAWMTGLRARMEQTAAALG